VRLRWAFGLLACALVGVGAAAAPLRVCLDFFPNPNHVPLYVALDEGLFGDLEIELIVPANPSDPVKLVAARTIEIALTPQINFLIARSEGLPVLSVGALVDRSLGGLLGLADAGIGSLADLVGLRIGYALAPLEPILWETMLACDGIPVSEVELINVGYATVASLLSGSVDAIGAFRNFEMIQVELWGETPVFFPQEAHCIPETYDIVLVAHPKLLEERGGEVQVFLDGLARGIARTREDPAQALEAFFAAEPDLDDELNRRAFEATLPLFAEGARHDDPWVWWEIQAYLHEKGLVAAKLPLDALYTAVYLPPREGE